MNKCFFVDQSKVVADVPLTNEDGAEAALKAAERERRSAAAALGARRQRKGNKTAEELLDPAARIGKTIEEQEVETAYNSSGDLERITFYGARHVLPAHDAVRHEVRADRRADPATTVVHREQVLQRQLEVAP